MFRDTKAVERWLGIQSDEEALPGIEFEGPLGRFWPLEEVPTKAILKGMDELTRELHRRGVVGYR